MQQTYMQLINPQTNCITSHGQTQFKNFAANEHHGQYQDGEDTNQNQIKNLCPFYIAFQVLKVYTSTLIKICKIHLPNLLGFFVFISFYISRYQFFSNLYRTENFIQHLKKKLSQIFLFKWIHSNSTSPTLLRPKFAKCMKTSHQEPPKAVYY